MEQKTYEIRQHDSFVELLLLPGLTANSLQAAVDELKTLAREKQISKLLVYIGLTYDEAGNMLRIEGLNGADVFRLFDKVALCAPDPAQYDYITRLNEIFKNMNVIKDVNNFKNFRDINEATAWIEGA